MLKFLFFFLRIFSSSFSFFNIVIRPLHLYFQIRNSLMGIHLSLFKVINIFVLIAYGI